MNGLYEVSNFGRVRSVERNIIRSDGRTRKWKSKILYLHHRKKRHTYTVITVGLSKHSRRVTHEVHRLVAEAFIDNPNDLPCVNHKDENPENNKLSNLEWCTRNYNYFYGTATERRKNNQPSKSVIQFDKNNYFLNKYSSIHEAERITGVKHYNIITVCKGKRKTAGGFIWKYENN